MLALILAWPAPASAQTHAIGRLFTTPEERYRIDVARGVVAAPPAPPAAPTQAAAPPPPPPPPVTVNGFIRRSNGRATVWLNQQSQDSRVTGFSGPPQAARVTVTLPSGQQVQIKPGQTVDMNAGTVRDVNER